MSPKSSEVREGGILPSGLREVGIPPKSSGVPWHALGHPGVVMLNVFLGMHAW